MGRPLSNIVTYTQRPGRRATAKPPHVQNPAWVTDVIASSWEVLQDTIAPAWMPKLDAMKPVASSSNRVTASVREYGCGTYGCVFPTADANVVMKVTSDESEAEFAAQLAATLVRPICVYYYSVMALDAVHKGRKVYLLWRESAYKVGEIENVLGAEALALVDAQHKAAQHAWLALMGREVPGVRGRPHEVQRKMIGVWLNACEAMARQTTVPQLRELGEGLVTVYDEQRVFFGDIHAGNLGLAHREDGGHWVITDPGYASVIDPEL